MAAIKQQGDSKKLFVCEFDLNDYPNPAEYTPKTGPQRTIVLKDETVYPQLDTMRLIAALQHVRARDHKYYYYILTVLVRNDIPIQVPMQELRGLFKEKYTDSIYRGYDRLCQAGLLIKQPNRRSTYFVNPAYAWKGNRADYLDISTLPLK